MDEQKYTLDGLPVVTLENLAAIIDLIRTRGASEDPEVSPYIRFIDRLKKENPHLFGAIFHLTLRYKNGEVSKDYIDGVLEGNLVVYESLRRQAAANKLEEELGK